MSITAKNAKVTASLIKDRVEIIEREIASLIGETHPEVIGMRKRLEVELSVLRDVHFSLTGNHCMMEIRIK